MSRDSSASDCSSWPFSRATAAWLASVSRSRRSSSENVVPSVSRFATTIDPISPASPSSGAAIALRISGSPRSGEMWRNARRSCATRRWRRSASASGAGDHHQRLAIVLADRQQALVDGLVAWPQQHLGALGAEHLAGVLEQGGERRVELGRVLEDPARLVQQLEPLVLLALRDVRPIGEEHRQQRDDEQGEQQRVQPQHRHGQQREARVGDRDQPAELDHLGQLLVLRGAAGHRDRASRS